jgi:minor extracellular serine protease Vpr
MTLLRHARARARTMRSIAAVATATAVIAGAPTMPAAASSDADARSVWTALFDAVRPAPVVSARQFIVEFEAPSLAEWQHTAAGRITPARQQRFMQTAQQQQQRVLDAIRAAGVEFDIRHSYLRVFNGASIVVHGDSSELIGRVAGVASVSSVRAVYPAAADRKDSESVVAHRMQHAASGTAHVALLDTGVDFNHPALAGMQAGPGVDVIAGRAGVEPGSDDQHGTEMAHAVVMGSGGRARILPYRILESRPVIGGAEAVVGTSDDLLAGVERAVDPDQDGATGDAASVILVAVTAPFAGFAGTPEDQAVAGADILGSVVVAAAGNDGASGDMIGTVGAPGAAREALSVGAVDLRPATPGASVHVRGGVVDTMLEMAPVITRMTDFPTGRVDIIPISGDPADPMAYLSEDLRSVVDGAVALIDYHAGTPLAASVRAAADAGATAVLVGGMDVQALAGVVDGRGISIPAVGVAAEMSIAIRNAAASGQTTVEFAHEDTNNPQHGKIASFASVGPRHDGVGKPDVVSSGVGVQLATAGRESGRAQYATVSGTSVASAFVAGQVAALRQRYPNWSAATVRAAVIATAQPVGRPGERPAVELQGAGIPDMPAAMSVSRIPVPSRIDFGVVEPGSTVHRNLALYGADGARTSAVPELLLESTRSDGPMPYRDGNAIAIQVAAAAIPGVYGGWIFDADETVRIPWTLVVRSPAQPEVPIKLTVDDASPARDRTAGARLGTLRVQVGGMPESGSLGLTGVQHLQLRLRDMAGRDRGTMAELRWVLPGVYTFGISGVGPGGAPLRRGTYFVDVRYTTSLVPAAPWSYGPTAPFRVSRES